MMLNHVYGRKPRCGEKGKEDDFSLRRWVGLGGCNGVRAGLSRPERCEQEPEGRNTILSKRIKNK